MGVGEKFYATAAMLPPAGVKVRVIWGGRGPFVAARCINPQTKRMAWLTEQDRKPVFLPVPPQRPTDPAKPWQGWHTLKGADPELWAPVRPDLWQMPLPEVASVVELDGPAKMFHVKQSLSEADMAAEMQAERDGVIDEPEQELRSSRVAGQWWRDASQIRYEPVAELSPRMAEGRVMRAVACCGYGMGLTLKTTTFSTLLTSVAEAVAAADEAPDRDWAPRLEPLPADHADFLTAMRWFADLNPPELRLDGTAWKMSKGQLVLVYRSMPIPWSFDEIGVELELSGERCRQINGAALHRIWMLGSGRTASTAPAHIDRLRERNRRAKREALAG